ncbi:MAG: hypothetical protein RPS47_04780 [Colwellia sp.]|jgi:hypothetical protein
MLNNKLMNTSWENALQHAQDVLPGVFLGFKNISQNKTQCSLFPENVLEWPFSIWCSEVEEWGTSGETITSNLLKRKRMQYIDIRDSEIDPGYIGVPSFTEQSNTKTLCQHAVAELEYLKKLWSVIPPKNRNLHSIEKHAIRSVFTNKERALLKDWIVIIDHLTNEKAIDFLDLVIPNPELYLDMNIYHEN